MNQTHFSALSGAPAQRGFYDSKHEEAAPLALPQLLEATQAILYNHPANILKVAMQQQQAELLHQMRGLGGKQLGVLKFPH
jgi:hypothetical protein